MDWTKAKNILIIALILTNLVLILAFSFKEDSNNISSEKALAAHLKTKNVIVHTEIPQKQNRMPVLSVKFDKIDEKVVQDAIKTQNSTLPKKITEESIYSLTDAFLEKCGAMSNSVKHDKIIQNDDSIIVSYKNIFEGITVEESYIYCTIKQGNVVGFDRYWLTPIKSPRQKKEVIPASAALMKFTSENKEEEKIYIKNIELVYWVDRSSINTETSVEDTVLPTWKITYNQGKIKHIPAFK